MTAYLLSADPDDVDFEAVWRFLSTDAYWHRWRERADVEAQVAGAWRVVGAYERDGGEMVGFARAVSDGVAIAYLSDVFVLPEHRGRGLGKALLTTMIDEGPGRDFRWMLHTNDAHGLYAGFGFVAPDAKFLERPHRKSTAPEGRPSVEATT